VLETLGLDDGTAALAPTPSGFGFDRPDPRFTAPAARDDLVRRSGLLAALDQEQRRPLILVTAPAGYGKTTLLAQWAAESRRPCAWVTLDYADEAAVPNALLCVVMCSASP
jgi:LuxR family maltose regulon positive regulatory protein